MNKGQTLVEVIVAVGVVGLVLTGIVLSATFGLKTSRVARERFEARRILQSKLESIRDERNSDPGEFFSDNKVGSFIEEGPDVITGNLAVYNRSVSYDYSVGGNEVEVAVEVVWEDFKVSETTVLTNWQ